MAMKKTVTVYCASRMKFDNINDFFAHSTRQGHSFYNSLPDHCTIDTSTDYDKTFNAVISDAKLTELPAYLHTLTIKKSDKIINAAKELPTQARENLRTLLEIEYQGCKSNVGHKADLYFLEHSECTLSFVMQNIKFDFTEEQIAKIMQLVQIDAAYNLDDNRDQLKIYNKAIISKPQSEQIMSPIHVKNANEKVQTQPEGHLKDILSSRTFGEYSQIHVYGLKNDAVYQDFIFRTIKSGFNSYSRNQFLQDIESLSHDLSPLKVTSTKDTASNTPPLVLPQTIYELDQLTDATSNDVSERQLENMKMGYHHATKLHIREDDGQMFVTKTMNYNLKDACLSEYEAYQIYEAFGVKVPKTHLIENGTDTILVMEYINGSTLDDYVNFPDISSDVRSLSKLREKVSADYAIDALLCNPDTGSYHGENVIVQLGDDEPYRIDMGFALNFHAQGAKKEPYQWEKVHISDFYSFRRSLAAKNYGGLSNDDILQRLLKASTCMSKVKKVASKENFAIISKRLKMSIKHFSQLCVIEKSFQDNKKTTTKKKNRPKNRKPKKLSARQKKVAVAF